MTNEVFDRASAKAIEEAAKFGSKAIDAGPQVLLRISTVYPASRPGQHGRFSCGSGGADTDTVGMV